MHRFVYLTPEEYAQYQMPSGAVAAVNHRASTTMIQRRDRQRSTHRTTTAAVTANARRTTRSVATATSTTALAPLTAAAKMTHASLTVDTNSDASDQGHERKLYAERLQSPKAPPLFPIDGDTSKEEAISLVMEKGPHTRIDAARAQSGDERLGRNLRSTKEDGAVSRLGEISAGCLLYSTSANLLSSTSSFASLHRHVDIPKARVFFRTRRAENNKVSAWLRCNMCR
jgi:hypothetical protein